jgi:hypothetical protein
VAEVDDAESYPTSLDCDECDDLLDIYVDEELAGQDVEQAYPLIWRHLEGCVRCNQAYQLLLDSLSRERSQPSSQEFLRVPMSPRLPFSASPSGNTPWMARLRSRIGGAPLGVVFAFNLSYLHSLLAPPALAAVRADDFLPSPASRLLLSDTVTVGEQNLVVEVTATRNPEEPEHLDLKAVISSSPRLSEKLWARLTWADQTRSAPVDTQGRVEFGAVSLARLQAAVESGQGSFEIAFEVKGHT